MRLKRPVARQRQVGMMTAMVEAGGQPELASVTPAEAGEEFLRIGEIAKTYGVTLRTLRFYEDKGLLTPKRDGSTRLYAHRDISRLRLILLGRKVGFSLREVKQMMDLYDPSGANTKQLKVALDKGERQLLRLDKQRQLIEDAMGELRSALDAVQQKLIERAQQQPNLTN